MAKKRASKKSSEVSAYKKSLSHAKETERLLVQNFVSLQKVLVNLSGKFDDLTRQISELLKLFEDSAKVIVKNEMEKKNEDKGEKQLLDTMISILDQNKVIAKGLTLIYESMNDSEVPQKNQVVPMRMPAKGEEQPLERRKLTKEENGYSYSKAASPSPGPYPPRM